MRISTEIGSIACAIGEERAVECVARAGFDGWDFSMGPMCRYDRDSGAYRTDGHPLAGSDYLRFARRLGQIGRDNGIVCNQSHAPHPAMYPAAMPYLMRAIECTAEAGGSICVIHPDATKSVAQNAEMFRELIPFAAQCGVTIATENMWNWDREKDEACFASCATPASFCEHIDAVGSERMAACLDIGHAEMRGCGSNAVELIHALGYRLAALHIHDNDRWHDAHQLPFTMDINFPPIVQALADIGYGGWFTLEAYRHLAGRAAAEIYSGVQEMADAARRLARMFEQGAQH